jgi:hypothetical protein
MVAEMQPILILQLATTLLLHDSSWRAKNRPKRPVLGALIGRDLPESNPVAGSSPLAVRV